MTNATPPENPTHLEDRTESGARLYSPSAARNKDVIADILEVRLPRGARVLEIAGGTGEHAVTICQRRPDILWQPSDPDPASRVSQDAWRLDAPGQILPSLRIDTMEAAWWEGLGTFDAVYCANMIHIAPWEAALGLAQGAAQLLSSGGIFCLYGPFKEGEATASSNLDFDESLKRRNPAWGVRDLQSVKHMFADAGFNSDALIVTPKENRMLIFSK